MGLLGNFLLHPDLGGLLNLTAGQISGAGDAREGELGAIPNALGGTSTEISITTYIPELGGWVNIPTMVEGQTELRGLLGSNSMTNEDWDEASIAAKNRAIERVKAGQLMKSYGSSFDADTAAAFRSMSKDLFKDIR